MSDIEDLLLEEPVAMSAEQEERERKKARHLVHEALLSVSIPLDSRGLSRHFLPGLWYAAISIVINLLEKEDAITLLSSRHAIIHGFADNANAPPKNMTGPAMATYVSQVAKAAETILEKLEDANSRMEDLEIDYWFPETVLDAVITVLLPAWGPDHVRRALVEQSAWFIQNRMEIRNFMEPSRFATIPRAAPVKSPKETVEAVAQQPLPDFRPKRDGSNRTITAFMATTTFEKGQTAWIINMRIKFANGRHENREIFGTLADPTGNKTRIHVIHELALALCIDDGKADVEVRVTDQNLIRATPHATGSNNDWSKFDKSQWSDIEACFKKNAISFKIVDISLVDELQQRSDIILRNLEN